MLTRKQHDLLTFLDGRIRESGTIPTYDEMKDAMGLRSKSGVHRLVTNLQDRGYVRRRPNHPRGIEIVKGPSAPVVSILPGAVPVMGRLIDSTRPEELTRRTRDAVVPLDMLKGEGHFAIDIGGDWMRGAGIVAGDVAVMQETDDLADKDVVLADVGGRALLRRYRVRYGNVSLEPANEDYEVRIVPKADLKVIGRMIGLLRRY